MPTKQTRRRKKPPALITAYHAHVYYAANETRGRAAHFREQNSGAGTMNWSARIPNRCIRSLFRAAFWRRSCLG